MERPDRRRYFRINDWVGLHYRALDGREQHAATQGDNIQISSARIIEGIERELSAALNVLWQSNPGAANVIGLLNKKLDFIAAELELDYLADEQLKHENTRVNISACGMAFECAERFDVGEVLELNLQLKPTNSNLRLQGYVNGCDRADDGSAKPYLLRVDFFDIDTHVHEELIQHIVRRQSMQLGEQRQES